MGDFVDKFVKLANAIIAMNKHAQSEDDDYTMEASEQLISYYTHCATCVRVIIISVCSIEVTPKNCPYMH